MAISALTWPATLPQDFLIDGYTEEPAKTKIRTNMDASVAKQRNRFTTAADSMSGRMIMTLEQYAQFKDFYVTTLKNGALEFNFPVVGNPTQSQVVRFTEGNYEPTPLGLHWDVQLNLEKIP